MRLGIDIGGTFTDFMMVAPDGRRWVEKRLTTSVDPVEAVIDGLRRLLQRAEVRPDMLEVLIHGTTLATNAILERRGARTGMITTRGFSSLLDTGRELRYDLYDLALRMPEPLVLATLRREVDERIAADGSVLVSLDEAAVERAVAELRSAGCESIAICFLHSYANPVHEARAGRVAAGAGASVTLSSDVCPEIGEYARFTTATANAYVQPVVSRYLAAMAERLGAEGVRCPLLLMLSDGGTATVATAMRHPVRLLESGPAAGVLSAVYAAGLAGEDSMIAFDMGGTTAKACLVQGGEPLRERCFEAGRVHRFKRGSGLPIQTPTIRLIEIGAGGGSIAWVDHLGLLSIGPQSAGAEPGPACYGGGGQEPTVTDADLLLGYLDAASFLGGEMQLDLGAAKRSLDRLADRLGLDASGLARGIHDLVDENMATAIRVHVAETGHDPRRFALVATGGAGPVHAVGVARRLGIRRIICPRAAGVASALGLLVAPLRFMFARSRVTRIDATTDWGEVEALFRQLEDEARRTVPARELSFTRSADIRYRGQGYTVHVPLRGLRSETVLKAFEDAYRQLYGRTVPGAAVEAVTWRLTASGPTPSVGTPPSRPGPYPMQPQARRPIFLPQLGAMASVPVYRRENLAPGTVFAGPCVVEERESTAVVPCEARCRIDAVGNLIMDLGGESV